jgi:hypothetical protein
MKIHHARLQFGLWLVVCLPLPSHAGVEVPYWLYPEWIAAKVIDFHARNTERAEAAQAQAQAKKNDNTNGASNGGGNGGGNGNNVEQNKRKTTMVPVETAQPKMNEKYLSKDELAELRKQLRQKQ